MNKQRPLQQLPAAAGFFDAVLLDWFFQQTKNVFLDLCVLCGCVCMNKVGGGALVVDFKAVMQVEQWRGTLDGSLCCGSV